MSYDRRPYLSISLYIHLDESKVLQYFKQFDKAKLIDVSIDDVLWRTKFDNMQMLMFGCSTISSKTSPSTTEGLPDLG